jgi:hypothetical protein
MLAAMTGEWSAMRRILALWCVALLLAFAAPAAAFDLPG